MIRSSRKNRRPRACLCVPPDVEVLTFLSILSFDGNQTLQFVLSGDFDIGDTGGSFPSISIAGIPTVVAFMIRTGVALMEIDMADFPVSGQSVSVGIPPDYSNVVGLSGGLLVPGSYVTICP